MPTSSSSSPSRSGFAWLAAVTVLHSAFLLFQVQPLISRTILPWFGGSPAVWTTCMLFFQVLLLAGYGYAHLLTQISSAARQRWIHCGLLVAGAALLPIVPDVGWKPPDSLYPVQRILILLAAHVGLPYFLLSSTGPLVQAWFARVEPGSPYRLYALSNVGSLAGLLTYPVLVEPRLTTTQQGWMWSWSFAGFAALAGLLAWLFARRAQQQAPPPEGGAGRVRLFAWLALPALASMMLLATTARICQDIAVSPFMWVAPLCLYLLTFIICFDGEAWYKRLAFGLLACFSVLVVCNVMLSDELSEMYKSVGIPYSLGALDNDIVVETITALAMLFFVCMVCHGELVRCKPGAGHLTLFYLCVSAGGALGGVLVGVVFPITVSFYLEWNIGLAVSFGLAAAIVMDEALRLWPRREDLIRPLAYLIIFASLVLVAWAQLEEVSTISVDRQRSFYGVLSVRDHPDGDDAESEPEGRGGRALYSGRILHGFQFSDPLIRDEPTTYYVRECGVGLALEHYQQSQRPLKVGVVGLGAGTLATYGRRGDQFVFYEINPQALDFARRHFTFLKNCAADVEPVLGDGRVRMENEPPRDFDVLVLDAFTGDSIPSHLLTVESMRQFVRHLSEDGVIAFHVSNRHLDLHPVVFGLAEEFGQTAVEIDYSNPQSGLAACDSDWILVSRNQGLFEDPAIALRAGEPPRRRIVWTDNYSNLLEILD